MYYTAGGWDGRHYNIIQVNLHNLKHAVSDCSRACPRWSPIARTALNSMLHILRIWTHSEITWTPLKNLFAGDMCHLNHPLTAEFQILPSLFYKLYKWNSRAKLSRRCYINQWVHTCITVTSEWTVISVSICRYIKIFKHTLNVCL